MYNDYYATARYSLIIKLCFSILDPVDIYSDIINDKDSINYKTFVQIYFVQANQKIKFFFMYR